MLVGFLCIFTSLDSISSTQFQAKICSKYAKFVCHSPNVVQTKIASHSVCAKQFGKMLMKLTPQAAKSKICICLSILSRHIKFKRFIFQFHIHVGILFQVVHGCTESVTTCYTQEEADEFKSFQLKLIRKVYDDLTKQKPESDKFDLGQCGGYNSVSVLKSSLSVMAVNVLLAVVISIIL